MYSYGSPSGSRCGAAADDSANTRADRRRNAVSLWRTSASRRRSPHRLPSGIASDRQEPGDRPTPGGTGSSGQDKHRECRDLIGRSSRSLAGETPPAAPTNGPREASAMVKGPSDRTEHARRKEVVSREGSRRLAGTDYLKSTRTAAAVPIRNQGGLGNPRGPGASVELGPPRRAEGACDRRTSTTPRPASFS